MQKWRLLLLELLWFFKLGFILILILGLAGTVMGCRVRVLGGESLELAVMLGFGLGLRVLLLEIGGLVDYLAVGLRVGLRLEVRLGLMVRLRVRLGLGLKMGLGLGHFCLLSLLRLLLL